MVHRIRKQSKRVGKITYHLVSMYGKSRVVFMSVTSIPCNLSIVYVKRKVFLLVTSFTTTQLCALLLFFSCIAMTKFNHGNLTDHTQRRNQHHHHERRKIQYRIIHLLPHVRHPLPSSWRHLIVLMLID